MSAPWEYSSAAPCERVVESAVFGDRVLLAIDTALGSSVALGVSGRAYEVSHDGPRGHAEAIGALIERVLGFSGVAASAVTGVVAGVGPGPFTGLRVGIAAAHAFAVGRGAPLLPLHSHEAVALAALTPCSAPEDEAVPPGGKVRVVQDAKRRELFVTDFAGLDADGIPIRVDGPRLQVRADHVPVDDEVWPERIPAARLIELAARRMSAGRDFEEDRALYLRAPDVQPPKPGLLSGVRGR